MNENIKLFDTLTSYIFNELYKSFPKCINFTVNEEVEKISELLRKEKRSIPVTEYYDSLSKEDKNIFFTETMLWLVNNGFIDFASSYPDKKRPAQPMPYQYFMCVNLTLKGLNLLTSPPKAINKHKKLGEEIAEKVKNGALMEAGKLITEGMLDFVIEKGLK